MKNASKMISKTSYSTVGSEFQVSKMFRFYLKIEGFVRTRICSHEFSNQLLQIVFRWGDAGTKEVMRLPVINIERIKGGGDI